MGAPAARLSGRPGCRLGIPQTRTRTSRADRVGMGMPTRKPGNEMLTLNETCDRCGPAVRAVYRVTRDGELYFCGHCASRLWPTLSAQGWASTVALRAAGRARARPWST